MFFKSFVISLALRFFSLFVLARILVLPIIPHINFKTKMKPEEGNGEDTDERILGEFQQPRVPKSSRNIFLPALSVFLKVFTKPSLTVRTLSWTQVCNIP